MPRPVSRSPSAARPSWWQPVASTRTSRWCSSSNPLSETTRSWKDPGAALARLCAGCVVEPREHVPGRESVFPGEDRNPELVAMAKQRPGELQYVNPGSGTPPHLAALAFTRVTATVMAPISYRGAGPALADLMAGHVPIIFLGLSASAPQVQSGKLRALAVTGRKRVAEFP